MRNKILLFLLTFIGISQIAAASSVRDKYNFNSEWLLYVGDIPEAKEVRFQDTDWKKVTLPRPFNEDEAFRLSIEQLTDTICLLYTSRPGIYRGSGRYGRIKNSDIGRWIKSDLYG